ncbi:hypothetical protein IEQ34_015179 [Dendrobium chrysotoxum]|uniref:PLATZ transcription factor family protein n=1 Tax=Dendrobium chrysotoxum TaxID=161865 RepID=A0AAV7GLX3_DENCH|nr:hypothetical protein IEQ34_015179 [Dendrobium chrysotoxum]
MLYPPPSTPSDEGGVVFSLGSKFAALSFFSYISIDRFCRHCPIHVGEISGGMTMRRVAASLVPPWLEPLLTTPFFSICSAHAEAARNERNMFCLDCGGAESGAFCLYCRSERHAGHRVIQIRRSSYHDVVRVAEIQKVLDIGGVQTYVINSARVLFLNERPQPRASGKGASPHTCEICARSLLDPFRFCSLGCKLVGIKRNGDATFVPPPNEEDDKPAASAAGRGGRRWEDAAEEEQNKTVRSRDFRSATLPNSRRRKGIPRRAPFSS